MIKARKNRSDIISVTQFHQHTKNITLDASSILFCAIRKMRSRCITPMCILIMHSRRVQTHYRMHLLA